MPSAPTNYQLPFVSKEQLTADTYSFYFDRSEHPFEFLPGQYNRVILPHENPDDRGTSRFFTIASSPTQTEDLMITTRIVKSTFKHALLGLLPGQNVQFWGPTGQFVLHDEEQRPLVFLAGGIGLTPYHSMITYAAEKNLAIPMTLFVSFTVQEEMVFYDEFMEIAKQHSNIKIIYTITHLEQSEQPWSGEKGRISADMIKKYVPEPTNNTFYISGPGSMVDVTQELVKEMGVAEEQVIIEKFPGY